MKESTYRTEGPENADFLAWFNFVHPAVTVLGWDGWHRQRVPKRDVFSGIGILPMIHGLEAHATSLRATRSDCYPVLKQADFFVSAGALSENGGMGDEGIEHPPLALSKTPILETASAKSGAPKDENTLLDPDLAKIVTAWPQLSPAVRSAVLAIVRNAAGIR